MKEDATSLNRGDGRSPVRSNRLYCTIYFKWFDLYSLQSRHVSNKWKPLTSYMLLQTHVKDLEQRLSQMAGELSLSHSSVADLERRLNGCLLKAEADALVQRLAEAEDAASKAQATVSGLAYKAQVRKGEGGRKGGIHGMGGRAGH